MTREFLLPSWECLRTLLHGRSDLGVPDRLRRAITIVCQRGLFFFFDR